MSPVICAYHSPDSTKTGTAISIDNQYASARSGSPQTNNAKESLSAHKNMDKVDANEFGAGRSTHRYRRWDGVNQTIGARHTMLHAAARVGSLEAVADLLTVSNPMEAHGLRCLLVSVPNHSNDIVQLARIFILRLYDIWCRHMLLVLYAILMIGYLYGGPILEVTRVLVLCSFVL